MECPACHGTLSRVTAGGVDLDVCRDGCGGIWFDAFELKKLDEPNEYAGDELLSLSRAAGVTLDQTVRYMCPHCLDHTVMMRHFFSARRAVTVDECPECGGYWLDVGELRQIRDEFPDEAARRAAADQYFDEVFGGQLAAEKARSDEQLARAHRFANMFRFICPSHYIPGNQQWGAF